ncbi:hypothetical protein HYH02_005428 [Chlamydomonas schloesseri]|uniref:AB hydrolase-1 domain-containing protein n=1 Tax=Chlamydomonas schloesseri TaxID=2026947 RepID=A0A836B6P5_9CHLO|nr:hypothetical protein HYH02_005428 [Chlamydomonas schloesseri]|eukprot:KAG2449271.1 hypothetical protein HYH02_005428 [Chlamydomonas schloesseri]
MASAQLSQTPASALLEDMMVASLAGVGFKRRRLLIHGANGNVPFLGHAIQRFVRLGYTVLVHKARGVDRNSTSGPPGRQTTRLLASDAQAVVDGVWGDGSAFHLLGASLGGMVAQELLVYRLVAERLLGVMLLVTGGGQRWRPLPWRRAGRVRRLVLPQLGFREDDGGKDFDERFSRHIDASYSAAWLDGPAPPLPGSNRKPPAAATDAADAATGLAGPPTRRQVVTRLWRNYWQQLAALIRNSGVRLGVGVFTTDVFYPEQVQRKLAEALGAEVHCMGSGHADCLWLDGVGLAAGAALAVFRDSRV